MFIQVSRDSPLKLPTKVFPNATQSRVKRLYKSYLFLFVFEIYFLNNYKITRNFKKKIEVSHILHPASPILTSCITTVYQNKIIQLYNQMYNPPSLISFHQLYICVCVCVHLMQFHRTFSFI